MPQSSTESQIRARVDQFVSELSTLIREAALEAVGEALGRSGLASPAPRRAKKASRKKAGRRSTASSGADLADPVLAHIRSQPGSRSEDISAALGANPEDVKRALQALKAAGAVKVQGKARGTNYTAKGGGVARKAGKKKASRKKKGARRKTASAATASA